MLSDNRVVFSSYYPKVEKLENVLPVFSFITSLRLRLIHLFQIALSEPESSLLIGIVFGIKHLISDAFYIALQNSCVLHIITASGMNVVLQFFLYAFHRIFFGKKM